MDLKDRFEENRPLIDDARLPEGDFALFMAKAGRRLLRRRIFAVAVPAFVAAVAVLLIMVRPVPSAEKVYREYISYVETSRRQLSASDVGEQWIEVFESVAQESVPMLEMLPGDLSASAKAAIAKEHYDNIKTGLETIMENVR